MFAHNCSCKSLFGININKDRFLNIVDLVGWIYGGAVIHKDPFSQNKNVSVIQI